VKVLQAIIVLLLAANFTLEMFRKKRKDDETLKKRPKTERKNHE